MYLNNESWKDFLNTLTPNDLPPHELLLKHYYPAMLLKKFRFFRGLCNGTHFICGDFNCNPFKWSHFLIRLSFTMTINKSQGSMLDFVGVYLPELVFSHGQLYVALSRARTTSSINILTNTVSNTACDQSSTTYIVYINLLTLAGIS